MRQVSQVPAFLEDLYSLRPNDRLQPLQVLRRQQNVVPIYDQPNVRVRPQAAGVRP